MLFVFGSDPGGIQKAVMILSAILELQCNQMRLQWEGADRFDVRDEREEEEAGQLFSCFHWSIDLGALCASLRSL